ncbi:MAG: helix-turn-helix domain-containing protein, partial [Blastocatellia bacterium]
MNINQEKTNLLRGLGAQVRAFRMSANLTIKDLAEKAAMSPRFLIQLESGKGNISIAGLSRVAAVLERPLQELLPVGSDGSVRSEIW